MTLKPKIYLSPPHLHTQELVYIQKAFNSNWVAPMGENIDAFEKKVGEYAGVKHALAVNSGTSALHLAMRLVGVAKDDIVLCPTFTFVATANPIVYQNATPFLVDSEPQTWNICPQLTQQAIEKSIREGKKPKALIVVHLYGQSAQMQELIAISNYYEIPLIEDAAEALGSSYQGKKLGSLGHLSILSFNGNKIITTSAGGMLLSNDKDLIERGLYLATQAKEDAPHYQHSETGYNYRMSNVLAGIGLGQMQVIEERVQKRRANFDYYYQHLADVVDFQPEPQGFYSNRWLSCILLKSYHQREKVRLALENENIESRPLWKPLHLQPVFQKSLYLGKGIAEDLFEKGLCLPSGSGLSEEDLSRIVSIIHKVLEASKV
jgi:dTDP-4-amino-4,6-dideoxygalactose transaminase